MFAFFALIYEVSFFHGTRFPFRLLLELIFFWGFPHFCMIVRYYKKWRTEKERERESLSSDKPIHYNINIHIIVSINSQYQYTIFQYRINWRTSRLAMANFATSVLQIMSSVASAMIDVHPGTIIFLNTNSSAKRTDSISFPLQDNSFLIWGGMLDRFRGKNMLVVTNSGKENTAVWRHGSLMSIWIDKDQSNCLYLMLKKISRTLFCNIPFLKTIVFLMTIKEFQRCFVRMYQVFKVNYPFKKNSRN